MLKILVAGGFHTNKHFPIHLRLNLSTALDGDAGRFSFRVFHHRRKRRYETTTYSGGLLGSGEPAVVTCNAAEIERCPVIRVDLDQRRFMSVSPWRSPSELPVTWRPGATKDPGF